MNHSVKQPIEDMNVIAIGTDGRRIVGAVAIISVDCVVEFLVLRLSLRSIDSQASLLSFDMSQNRETIAVSNLASVQKAHLLLVPPGCALYVVIPHSRLQLQARLPKPPSLNRIPCPV